jgi:hypothetical protein
MFFPTSSADHRMSQSSGQAGKVRNLRVVGSMLLHFGVRPQSAAETSALAPNPGGEGECGEARLKALLSSHARDASIELRDLILSEIANHVGEAPSTTI